MVHRAGWLTLAIWFACASAALPAGAALEFFVTTDIDTAHAKNPSRYDRVPPPPGSGKHALYVERRASLSIPVAEIQSVTIVRKPFAHSMEDAIRDLQGLPARTQPERAAWDTTFVLAPKAARRLADLMNAHDKGFLDVRFNAQRIGVARVMGPFMGQAFRLYLPEMDRAAVERLFQPLEKRVVWKDDG